MRVILFLTSCFSLSFATIAQAGTLINNTAAVFGPSPAPSVAPIEVLQPVTTEAPAMNEGYCGTLVTQRACQPTEKICGTTTVTAAKSCGYDKRGKCVATATVRAGTIYCPNTDEFSCHRSPSPRTRALLAVCEETITDTKKECGLVTKTQIVECGEAVTQTGSDGVIITKNHCRGKKDETTCVSSQFETRREDSSTSCSMGQATPFNCMWITYKAQ